MTARLRPYGDAAVLVEPADPASVLALAAALRQRDGVLEVVPAARTLLVRATRATLGDVVAHLPDLARDVDPGQTIDAGRETVELDVRYDGEDLDEVAAELGLDRDEVIARHCRAEYVVAFCGFAPGFGYLTGLDPALHCARLAEPRTRVPAGAVAIAGEYAGVYPRPSPGGWRLLGSTGTQLWDAARTPPAVLVPGTTVRFRPA